MTTPARQVGGGRASIGDIAPKLAELTDDVLFDDVWNREGLSPRDRSMVTVASLITSGAVGQLPFHMRRAIENGVTQAELIEVITHVTFYAGWPRGMSAAAIAKEVFGGTSA